METLCWECKKAIGGCLWADSLQPVDGWDAEPTIVKDEGMGDYESFIVKACPMYEPDARRIITRVEIADILGVHKDTVSNRSKKQIIEEMKNKGYTVKYSWADKLWYEIRR